MLCGLTHLCLPVSDLDRARAIYAGALGFVEVGRGERHLDLEASSLVVRLELSPGPVAAVSLRVQTLAIEEVAERLRGLGASERRAACSEPESGLRTAELTDGDGHHLVLWRRLREDELPAAPPLPISRPWTPAAERLACSLLAGVPEPLRDLARRGTVAEAEHLCSDEVDVDLETYVRAFIRATPRLVRDELRRPLSEHGFDPDRYAEDFAC